MSFVDQMVQEKKIIYSVVVDRSTVKHFQKIINAKKMNGSKEVERLLIQWIKTNVKPT